MSSYIYVLLYNWHAAWRKQATLISLLLLASTTLLGILPSNLTGQGTVNLSAVISEAEDELLEPAEQHQEGNLTPGYELGVDFPFMNGNTDDGANPNVPQVFCRDRGIIYDDRMDRGELTFEVAMDAWLFGRRCGFPNDWNLTTLLPGTANESLVYMVTICQQLFHGDHDQWERRCPTIHNNDELIEMFTSSHAAVLEDTRDEGPGTHLLLYDPGDYDIFPSGLVKYNFSVNPDGTLTNYGIIEPGPIPEGPIFPI